MAKYHGLASAALQLYKDKIVEINTNEVQTTLTFNDFSVAQKSLIRGKLVDAIEDAIILECNVNGHTQRVIINCWLVYSIMALEGHGSLKDIYEDEFRSKYYNNKK